MLDQLCGQFLFCLYIWTIGSLLLLTKYISIFLRLNLVRIYPVMRHNSLINMVAQRNSAIFCLFENINKTSILLNTITLQPVLPAPIVTANREIKASTTDTKSQLKWLHNKFYWTLRIVTWTDNGTFFRILKVKLVFKARTCWIW